MEDHHLCVLIHGLWGNPSHLENLRLSLAKQNPSPNFHVLVAKSNSSNYTYDGIDVGGERVAKEVEDHISSVEKKAGKKITKISVVGYSLGGCVARYAIGLLYSRGLFENIQPVNFNTFATPHLGCRSPFPGYVRRMFNSLGGNMLSTSGRQLFLIDDFQNTGRPILSVLADPGSIFIKALAQFKNRHLYANVVNDRSVPFYTAMISTIDPFTDDVEALDLCFEKDYEPVILESDLAKITRRPDSTNESYFEKFVYTSKTIARAVPFYGLLAIFVPLGATFFTINSGIQHFRSNQRIQSHHAGKTGISYAMYRIPLMIEHAAAAAAETHHHEAGTRTEAQRRTSKSGKDSEKYLTESSEESSSSSSSARLPKFPQLDLSPEQFEMIRNLDSVGFEKHPVYIHDVRHSHAAIVVRINRKSFKEGRMVLQHWVSEVFEA
ncbi:hypothetical protein MMC25_000451 [Agyrium rufum]|nr:hypothetical protein [Agyrium rufum]